MSDVQTEFLFEMKVNMREGYDVGVTPGGARRIGNIGGGTFEGPRLKGEVLNSGADWLIVRPDGLGDVDVRAALRTDDGEVIYMSYRGLVLAPMGAPERPVRTTPYFSTSSEKYGWLNRTLAIGIGRIVPASEGNPTRVIYNIFAVK